MPCRSRPPPAPPHPPSPSPKQELHGGGLERGLVLLVLILTVLCGLILLLLIRSSQMEAYITQRHSESSVSSSIEHLAARTGRGERHGKPSHLKEVWTHSY
ncbi:hypothetical protein BIW11_06195 [Tropilaelaps mercedesae]|uniref:Uncharacterized protein n=1 Tax=Tropilaelaps mercedesae TaxID=418985 RepID=A0A1V9XZ45_9ACAR|nr:hypothetical protein BIW11_06195 [Tropilaelaps mercedesae]